MKLKTKKAAFKRFKNKNLYFYKRSGFNHLRRKKQNKILKKFNIYKKLDKSNHKKLNYLIPN